MADLHNLTATLDVLAPPAPAWVSASEGLLSLMRWSVCGLYVDTEGCVVGHAGWRLRAEDGVLFITGPHLEIHAVLGRHAEPLPPLEDDIAERAIWIGRPLRAYFRRRPHQASRSARPAAVAIPQFADA